MSFLDDAKAPPFRRQFDNARTPYAARNALGLLSSTGGPFQPLDGDLTAIAALTGVNVIYYRSGTDAWSPVTIGSGLTFSGGTLSSTSGISDAPSDGNTYARKNAAWSRIDNNPFGYVLKAGDTMTGDLTISKSTPALGFNKSASGQTQGINGYTNSVLRWSVAFGDANAESGSNVGSNFAISRFNDAGTAIDTPLNITRSSGAVAIRGTQTNDAAIAGNVGEYITGTQTTPQALTSATALSIASVTLTAGDWDVQGIIQFGGAITTTQTLFVAWVGTAVNTLDQSMPVSTTLAGYGLAAHNFSAIHALVTPVARFSLASTTVVFVSAWCTFGTSTENAKGFIWARRKR